MFDTMTTATPPRARSRRPHGTDYDAMLQTLSEGSVHVHFDPYDDIDWDAAHMQLDPADPKWVLSPTNDPLGATAWYRAQSHERQVAMAAGG